MPILKDITTGFDLADPEILPFSESSLPTTTDVSNALKPMILSASGWRKVFAIDGDEESKTTEISIPDRVIAAAMAKSFGDFLISESKKSKPTVVLAQDSRYTGSAIADVMIRVFTSLQIDVQYIFISAAPETFAYTKNCESVDGFAYISASHNPIGHNGVKFGLKTGGVLDGSQVKPLIEVFKNLLSSSESISDLVKLTNSAEVSKVKDIYGNITKFKSEAYSAYKNFTDLIVTGSESKKEQQIFLSNLKHKIEDKGFGIVSEYNGSARTLTIDKEYLEYIGVKVTTVNDKPREITHRIVPEGRSLNLCKDTLDKMHKIDSSYALGYVPDNDGDRGNLVYFNDKSGESEIIEAQTVFAISVLSELASIYYTNPNPGKVAVCVNGPTSMRIDEIAKSFGAETFRAEVGEANVVNLANIKRSEGYIVRILGEGSNGGNITYPAAVRDPLNTISAFMKLLTLTSEGTRPGLFEIWCNKSGQADKYIENFTLTDVIETLPKFVTTSAYEDRAILKIKSKTHGILKSNYENLFLEAWESSKAELKDKFGIVEWEEINSEGTNEKSGMGSDKRSGAETGGLKILLKNSLGENEAYLWMRGSGTEPVFRVLVDSKTDNLEKEAYLLNWHTNIILSADNLN